MFVAGAKAQTDALSLSPGRGSAARMDDAALPALARSPSRRLVAASTRHAWATIVAALLLTGLAGWFAATHFAITADTGQLIAGSLPWKQDEARFDAAFPQTVDTAVVVIDAVRPEIAEAAAAMLAQRLAQDPARFRHVERPDGGAFFDRYGLLLLPTAELTAATGRLIAAQPLLAPLAADPSLRGIMNALATASQAGDTGKLKAPLAKLDAALRAVLAARDPMFSWRGLIDGEPDSRTLRRFVVVQPKLDFGAVEPGAESTAIIRARARGLGLDAAHGVRVRLTGPVPLADEEFATLGERAVPITVAMLGAIIVLLWFASRSGAMIVAILTTTIAGLVITAALGLVTVGRFNLISVAFIPLFVGLGIDFGIQFCVRFRAERMTAPPAAALAATGAALGTSLALAAAATAAGFFAFLPTDYVGVSELGVIAGAGMAVAFVLSLTLLPALLMALKPAARGHEAGIVALGRLEGFVERRRRAILGIAAVVALICLATVPLLRFDFNPLHLRSPRVESMATVLELMRDPANTPNTIEVLAANPDAATALAARLSKLADVAQAVTLTSFAPRDQSESRAILDDAAMLLDTVLMPISVAPPPSDDDDIASLRTTATALAAVSLPEAKALAATLVKLADGPPAMRARATAALIPGLDALLGQIRTALQPGPLTLAQLPPTLAADWQASDGRTRIELFPRANDNAALTRFSNQVLAVAPDATGTPIGIRYSGQTIVAAFIKAGILSLLAIAVLLYIVLRRVRDVVLTLTPILLSGLLTLATCVVVGLPLNFANIIALPLMFGIGVAFHIYLIMAWRQGQPHLLGSSLARGVLFSALTTGIAFGALALSSHPGTASMGVLLMISLAWTLFAALVFKPALLASVSASPAAAPTSSSIPLCRSAS